MLRAGAGLSTAPDPLRAVDDAIARARADLGGEDRPDFVIVFVSSEHHERSPLVLARVAAMSGTPYVVGCTGAGIIGGGDEVESGPAIAVLLVVSDVLRATPFLFEAEDLGYTTGVRLGERLLESRGTDDLVLVWPDPFHVRPDRLLRGLAKTLDGVAVAGGAASSRLADGSTYQFRGEDYRPAAVSGVRLGGEIGYRIAVTQGCRPLGAPMRVTGAHENVILEIEGRPALEVLRELAPDDLLDDPTRAMDYLFVGLVPVPSIRDPRGGDYLIRNIVAIDPDTGVLGIGAAVDEGQRIVFAVREARTAREDVARMTRDLRSDADGLDYRFGLYFNCVARGRSLYGDDGVDARLIREAFPDVPVVGFFCNAEFAPAQGANRLYTYTGVLVLVGERRRG